MEWLTGGPNAPGVIDAKLFLFLLSNFTACSLAILCMSGYNILSHCSMGTLVEKTSTSREKPGYTMCLCIFLLLFFC